MAMTVNGKGKNAFPKTPFQPSSVQPLGGKQRILMTTSRPLGDKTPLPNRFGGNILFQTPLPGMSKLSKLNKGGTPDSVQRPSSMRKHIKQPRNSGGKAFETPVNNGNPWDVSDGGIVIPEVQPETTVEDEGDDKDEIEYGPPNTLDLPYAPPFDFELPDYKQVGKTLFQLAHSCYYDDAPLLPEPDFKAAELENIEWDMIPLPAIESDDPFYLARLESLTLPPAAKAGIARPRILARNAKPPTAKPVPQPSVTKAPSRTVATRPVHKPTSSTTSQKSTIPSATSSRSNSAASAKTVVPTVNSKPTVKPTTAALSRLASTRVVTSNTTAHPGGVRQPSSAIAPRKATEARRPHTALAVGTKAKGNPRVVPSVDEVIVFKDVGLEDDLDFKFDV
ncbi:hypothetical protein BDN70DRAFT_836229 [Pholiota conissans]|uniref:Uncharacterized protein n=1 Tax=Pholiota conissans TaxID=109636 RepID=A0A9P5YZH8_9AGAR|nr:hypothetical protein BDN70DRAFT_836229 [Pholiota conissans]